jgi:hypothetical protein
MILCAQCRRHVRLDEGTCPFCAGALLLRPKPVPPMRGRGTRTEILLFATTLAMGCSGVAEEPTPSVDGGAETSGDTRTSDVGEFDTNFPVTDTGTLDNDTGGAVPIYGAAPFK